MFLRFFIRFLAAIHTALDTKKVEKFICQFSNIIANFLTNRQMQTSHDFDYRGFSPPRQANLLGFRKFVKSLT